MCERAEMTQMDPVALTQSTPVLTDKYFVQVFEKILQVLTPETFSKPSAPFSQCSFGFDAVF